MGFESSALGGVGRRGRALGYQLDCVPFGAYNATEICIYSVLYIARNSSLLIEARSHKLWEWQIFFRSPGDR